MPKPKDTCWRIDSHTLAKHRILLGYLQAWLPIVGTSFPRIRLIDGFAGPGRYASGEPGSPIIMLQALLEHAARASINARISYVFIEEREDRFEELLRSIDTLRAVTPFPANMAVDPRHGRFDKLMPLIAPADEAQRPPTFAFIDPFGWTDVPMELHSSILGIEHFEALIYVPLPHIARFAGDPAVEDSLTLLYGDESWKTACSLSGEARIKALRSGFQAAMRQHSRYVQSFDIRPDRRRGYTLFFGTHSLKGLEKMKDAMWSVDAAGGCLYTDTTDPNQEVLFKPQPDFRRLESMLLEHFADRAFPIEAAEQHVLASTPFKISHLRAHTLRPAEAAGRLSAVDPAPGRKRGTYPQGTRLRFET